MNRQSYRLVKVFKALSDPTRVRILKLLLKQKSLCVCEIMQALDISQAQRLFCLRSSLRILTLVGSDRALNTLTTSYNCLFIYLNILM